MQITHLGHSCLLLEYDDAGCWSTRASSPATSTSSRAWTPSWSPTSTPTTWTSSGCPGCWPRAPVPDCWSSRAPSRSWPRRGVTAEPFAAGEQVTIGGAGGVIVEGVGGQHAEIYREIPRIGNTGLVLRAEGAPTVFHPGDMIDTTPEGIDLLAVPLTAPWSALKETIDFVRAVRPAIAVPIHDAIVSPPGRGLYLTPDHQLRPRRDDHARPRRRRPHHLLTPPVVAVECCFGSPKAGFDAISRLGNRHWASNAALRRARG